MMKVRKGAERGRTEAGWLHGRHTFSFGEYYDPAQMGFRGLRVINEDVVEPGGGFGTHGHRDMEIITVVLSGRLRHEDSLGHGATLAVGEVQTMSAGTGIRHSEMNESQTERVHLLQIWIEPRAAGLESRYAQKAFAGSESRGRLRRVAGGEAIERDAALSIQTDADVHLAALEPGEQVEHVLRAGRGAWVQVAAGAARVNGATLRAGDGAQIEGDAVVRIEGAAPATMLLLFDLA
jgi:quercetin 2,3-dioxygenase